MTDFDFDESLLQVKSYDVLGKLPDLFTFADGGKVVTPADWQKRRAEIFPAAVELQYGTQPGAPDRVTVEPLYVTGRDRKGYRVISQIGEKEISFTLYLFMPNGVQNPPVVVDGDRCWNYAFDREWLNVFLDNGIALALFDRTELAHDVDGERDRSGPLYGAYPDRSFGAIGAWAWGYSRAVDALEIIGGVDLNLVAFTGHSRGAKTAMLAGVLDERAAIVNPNETNCGACGCYRIHMSAEVEGELLRSETLADMVKHFPEWLGEGMRPYADREQDLPFDCHFLKALVAPRTLLVAEACYDIWTNPIGSWQTSMAATEAYRLLGREDELLWYFRRGRHKHSVTDVKMLASVICAKRDGTPLDTADFFKKPFPDYEKIY